jgi:hypothetical protein
MSDKSVSSQYARREFLKLTSVAVAGLAGSGWPSFALGALRQLPASILSTGYAASEPKEGALVRLSSAESLLMGDSSFISRDAQVTIRSSRAIARSGNPGVAIDVVFPALGYQPESYPTYHAWSYREDQYQQHVSSPVSFRVPIEATSGLRLLFTRFKAEPATTASVDGSAVAAPDDMVQLSLGSSSSAAKLQRGIYVVAYGEPGVPSVPNWSALSITRRGNDLVVPEAKFSYLVLSVDYAS